MVFSSYAFLLVFLPSAVLGFYAFRACGAFNASVTFLLAASFIFYAYWSLPHLALLIGSIAANYWLGRMVVGCGDRSTGRTIVTVGIIANLTLIFWFKYLDFAGSNIAALTGGHWTLLNFLLPLGISFFTFQQIAYLIDCYKNDDSERNFRDYALFVSFFPQLIAGPIVHHSHTRPQFAKLHKGPLNLGMAPFGLIIFAMGLFKKTIIADPIARTIDPIYSAAAMGDPISSFMAWTAMIGYALQIYFDFSGYCDMAIGIGLIFGVRLPINFNSPYKANSIIEFWRRWHITLSNFLRDYVYIPLGGNRFGKVVRLRNIFLTMIIGGIWHGAAWTFVIWGAIHAVLITSNHLLRLCAPSFDRWNDLPSIILKRTTTLLFVMLAWVFFRADSPSSALEILVSLTNGAENSYVVHPAALALILFAGAIALFAPNSLEVAAYSDNLESPYPPHRFYEGQIRPTPMAASATAIMLACGLFVAWEPSAFIYFNF